MADQLSLIGSSEVEFAEPDRDCWATPWWLIRELERRFGPFTLDVCCLAATAKAARFFTPNEDGLVQAWSGHFFCNPPYSLIDPWVAKATIEIMTNPECFGGVMLLPSRTERPWYQDLRMLEAKGMATIIHPEGRLPFIPPPGAKPSSNNEPSIIVSMWPKIQPLNVPRAA